MVSSLHLDKTSLVSLLLTKSGSQLCTTGPSCHVFNLFVKFPKCIIIIIIFKHNHFQVFLCGVESDLILEFRWTWISKYRVLRVFTKSTNGISDKIIKGTRTPYVDTYSPGRRLLYPDKRGVESDYNDCTGRGKPGTGEYLVFLLLLLTLPKETESGPKSPLRR